MSGSSAMTLTLHSDDMSAVGVQKFRLLVSQTFDRTRMLGYDGGAVTDGHSTIKSQKESGMKAQKPIPPHFRTPAKPRRPPPPPAYPNRASKVNTAEFQGTTYGFPNRNG